MDEPRSNKLIVRMKCGLHNATHEMWMFAIAIMAIARSRPHHPDSDGARADIVHVNQLSKSSFVLHDSLRGQY